MKSNPPKQFKEPAERQPGLQFKTTKKRTNRRPARSKSSISSKPDNKQNNYQLINCAQNERAHIEYDTNMHQIDFGKSKCKANYVDDQYTARMVMRAYQYQAKAAPTMDQHFKDKASIVYVQDPPMAETSSNNSISVWGHQQNHHFQFRYTAHELSKGYFHSSSNTSNHIRNRTQTFDQVANVAADHQKPKNFWSSRKNRNVQNVPSINQESSTSQLKVSNFQLGLCSSEDIFGKLYPARHLPSGCIVCLKIINKREVQHDLDRLIQCLKLQSYQSKEYITEIYGIFEENEKIYVVMEYHTQGMLFMIMKSQIRMTPKDCLGFFHNICSAVRDLHSVNVVYRNFKPQNISLFYDTCKISNMCWSSRVENQKNNYSGTIEYYSPELVVGCKYNKQSDIWGLGVLLYEIAMGVAPCHNLSRRQARHRIINVQFLINNELNGQMATILEKIFVKDPSSRVTIEQLIQQIERAQKQLQP